MIELPEALIIAGQMNQELKGKQIASDTVLVSPTNEVSYGAVVSAIDAVRAFRHDDGSRTRLFDRAILVLRPALPEPVP